MRLRDGFAEIPVSAKLVAAVAFAGVVAAVFESIRGH